MSKRIEQNDSLVRKLQSELQISSLHPKDVDYSNFPDIEYSKSYISLSDQAILYQNSPNPFSDGTVIRYFIPENCSATLNFYNEFGNLIKIHKIVESGYGELILDSVNLSDGIYSYSLSVNGRMVDSKMMVKVR